MAEKNFLVDHLISEIKRGTFQLDKKLPSEHILADQFNVPRMVVRKAYEQLQDLGYIYSKQGKGSYVQDSKKQIPLILSGDVSFTEKMKEFQFAFQTITIFCEEISYDQKIFQSLDVESDEKVYKIGRLRLIDEFPIALHTSYVAKSTFPEIDKDGPDITSMFLYYRQRGYVEFGSSSSTLNVIFPTLFEREILQCSSLIPLLQVESVCVDKGSNQVLEHTVIVYRSDCFTYVI
ncbi:GntR family transcriptional regulator [Peribacillus butanolivorans]|uniref:GntR family transcriptional regulator n=1 Tax=Peribacillus butanolivorans TaxID=421767 RepID=UPI00362FF036